MSLWGLGSGKKVLSLGGARHAPPPWTHAAPAVEQQSEEDPSCFVNSGPPAGLHRTNEHLTRGTFHRDTLRGKAVFGSPLGSRL